MRPSAAIDADCSDAAPVRGAEELLPHGDHSEPIRGWAAISSRLQLRNTRHVRRGRQRFGRGRPVPQPPRRAPRELGVVEYDEFRQRVRRFRRADVLRSVAAMATSKQQADLGQGPPLDVPNYVHDASLAGVARTAIASANDYRGGTLNNAELIRLCGYYANVRDPGVDAPADKSRLRYILGRLAYEQFGFQYSLMENVGRTLALLVDEAPHCAGAPSEDEWTETLGAPLGLFMQVGFGLHVAIVKNRGAVARHVLLMDHVAPIWKPLTPDQAMSIADRHFVGQPNEMAAWTRRWEVKDYEKWSPNPLQAWPLVALGNDLVGPTPRYIADKITPSGLYYTGLTAFGRRFTDALGCMFERYVGRQLDLLQHAAVHRAREYGSPKKETTDFLLVTDEAVILIEVKASRPVLAVRTGQTAGDDDVAAKVGHACEQIDNTASLIVSGDPVVADIPTERPVIGLVVTLEPWYMTETLAYDDLIPQTSVPITIASAHELEGVVAALASQRDVGRRLVDALTPGPPVPPLTTPAPTALRNAAVDLESQMNPILEDGWQRFAFHVEPTDT